MIRIATLALAGTLLVAAAGCASAPTIEAQPAPVVLGSSLSLALNPWMTSGESGQVVFTPLNATQTQVAVSFTGSPGPHQGFLHVGSCANMGAVVAPLGTLDVGANHVGTRTVTVNVPLSTLRDGDHFIAFHQAFGTPGNAVACADIPTP